MRQIFFLTLASVLIFILSLTNLVHGNGGWVKTTQEEHGYDGSVLIDGSTGLLIPPMGDEKFGRDLSIYSKWSDKYCKVNAFEFYSYPLTDHYWKPSWCRKQNEDGSWKNLCCGNNICHCDSVTGIRCWCYSKTRPKGPKPHKNG